MLNSHLLMNSDFLTYSSIAAFCPPAALLYASAAGPDQYWAFWLSSCHLPAGPDSA
jgi:hypothetical protein